MSNATPSEHPQDMLALVEPMLLDELDDAQAKALEHWLSEDEQNRVAFLREVHLCRGIRQSLFAEASSEAMSDTLDASQLEMIAPGTPPEATTTPDVMSEVVDQALALRRQHEIEDEANRQLVAQQAEDARNRRFELRRSAEPEPTPRVVVIPKVVVWLGFAAVLGLAAWIGWPKAETASTSTPPQTAQQDEPQDPQHAPQPVYVARIDASVDAQWEGLDAAAVQLEQGKLLILRHGMVQVTFDDGATVLVEAPATFQPTGPNGMRLVEGRLSATVPPSGHGFEVVTPFMAVTDLGTEFGVEVDRQSGTATDVFTGRVIAESFAGAHAARLDLLAGQSTQADTSGRLAAVSVADATRFYRDIETFAASPQVNGQGLFLSSRPERVTFHTFESSDHIAVFLERHAVAWQDGWVLDELAGAYPAVGQPVDVYLAHFDPVGAEELAHQDLTREVVLHFDRPIVGLITSAERLQLTDNAMGHPQTVYPVGLEGYAKQRGLDIEGDAYSIEDAGRTLRLRMQAGTNIDQIRVVVMSETQDD